MHSTPPLQHHHHHFHHIATCIACHPATSCELPAVLVQVQAAPPYQPKPTLGSSIPCYACILVQFTLHTCTGASHRGHAPLCCTLPKPPLPALLFTLSETYLDRCQHQHTLINIRTPSVPPGPRPRPSPPSHTPAQVPATEGRLPRSSQ
jgi:hypothetical protein